MRFLKVIGGLAALLVALGGVGCRPANPGQGGGAMPVQPGKAEAAEAPKGEAIADPVLREARDRAEAILQGLLAGKYENDPDLFPLAKKIKGYQSWTIQSQEMLRVNAAQFLGVLSAPQGRADFNMTLRKQQDGTWAVASFSGPNRE
jgi:hypothetical protein